MKTDDCKAARNSAIAEYFSAKKQCVDAKLLNINLENEQLKLRIEKLLLEKEKLNLELEKLRNQ